MRHIVWLLIAAVVAVAANGVGFGAVPQYGVGMVYGAIPQYGQPIGQVVGGPVQVPHGVGISTSPYGAVGMQIQDGSSYGQGAKPVGVAVGGVYGANECGVGGIAATGVGPATMFGAPVFSTGGTHYGAGVGLGAIGVAHPGLGLGIPVGVASPNYGVGVSVGVAQPTYGAVGLPVGVTVSCPPGYNFDALNRMCIPGGVGLVTGGCPPCPAGMVAIPGTACHCCPGGMTCPPCANSADIQNPQTCACTPRPPVTCPPGQCSNAQGMCQGPPQNGCPSGQQFSLLTCRCIPSGDCAAPASGCMPGSRWVGSPVCACTGCMNADNCNFFPGDYTVWSVQACTCIRLPCTPARACIPGRHLNIEGSSCNLCVNDYPQNTTCPASYHWNPQRGLCVQDCPTARSCTSPFVWNTVLCTCACPATLSCTAPQVLNPTTCTCQIVPVPTPTPAPSPNPAVMPATGMIMADEMVEEF